jgi:hypothetical protein
MIYQNYVSTHNYASARTARTIRLRTSISYASIDTFLQAFGALAAAKYLSINRSKRGAKGKDREDGRDLHFGLRSRF